MPENTRRLPRSVWLGCSLAFSLIGLAVMVSFLQNARRQPAALPVIGPVAGFTLTNQDSRTVTLADLTNHVWIADIIFTPVSYTHLRAHETRHDLVCRLLLEKKK